MSTTHTPGKWAVRPEECDRPYIRVRGTRLGGRYKIANVLTPTYEGVNSREAEETRANAALIAAAPDMYAALREVESYLESHADAECFPGVAGAVWNDAMRLLVEVRAAIAKAEGKP